MRYPNADGDSDVDCNASRRRLNNNSNNHAGRRCIYGHTDCNSDQDLHPQRTRGHGLLVRLNIQLVSQTAVGMTSYFNQSALRHSGWGLGDRAFETSCVTRGGAKLVYPIGRLWIVNVLYHYVTIVYTKYLLPSDLRSVFIYRNGP